MKKYLPVLVIGLLLRLVVMPYSLHSDLRGHYLGAYIIAIKGDLLGVYDYISRLPRTDPLVTLYHDDFLVYSPLTYLFHALFMKALRPLYPPGLYYQMVLDIGSVTSRPDLPWLLFLLKLPYLAVEVGCVYFFLRLLPPAQRKLGAWLWAFNLPLIYSAYLIGQFDILLVLFILASLWFATAKKYTLSAILMAIAAGFKPFPLFLLPFLPGRPWRNIVVGLITYFLIILPYLPSPGFRMYSLVAPQTDKIWYAKIPISGSQHLPLFLVGVVLLFWLHTTHPQRSPVWIPLFSVLLLFYSLTHYHPQWFAWISPFLLLCFLAYPKLRPSLTILGLCFVVVVLSFDASLNFGLFGLNFDLFKSLNAYYPADQLVSFVRGAFAATSLFIFTRLHTPDA